jgi:hypothetical protein
MRNALLREPNRPSGLTFNLPLSQRAGQLAAALLSTLVVGCSESGATNGAGAGAGGLGPTGPGVSGGNSMTGAGAGNPGGGAQNQPGGESNGGTPSGGAGGQPGGSGGIGGGGPDPVMPVDGCTLYAAPDGAGSECSAQVPCSLFAARDKVRTLNANLTQDLEVCLAGGTYSLSETFELNASDSGSGGFNVVWRALESQNPPTLSGGRQITGFEVHDQGKNIYKAAAAGLSSRQLFVNGVRAIRARSTTNYGMTERNDHGFNANTTELAGFKNKTRMEVTGELDWRHYRCPVESIEGNNVRLKDPCWALSQDIPGGWWQFKTVTWVENAYELLDAEGEFYLDEEQDLLFYKPRQGEDLATATVIAPVLETLVRGRGTVGAPLHHVVFRGITFAHGTWHEPSTDVGYTSWQSGFLHRTLKEYYDTNFFVMPSNLVFEVVENLRFEGNRFINLGASGLDIFHASKNNSIVGNRFEDISGRAITLGHLNDYAAPENEIIRNNVIKNNAIFHSGVEYRDCAIIFVGYTQDTLIEHNWLRFGPYIGVSLGWGWANHPDQWAARNIVRWNRIEDFMMHTFDGSGVYALGPQRDSSVDHNYIYRGLPRGEGIFPDQGAAYMKWEWNVIEDVGWEWIHDWSDSAHHNTIRFNITNQPKYEYSGSKLFDTWGPNTIVTDGNWPAEYHEIKAKAGLEPAFTAVAQ